MVEYLSYAHFRVSIHIYMYSRLCVLYLKHMRAKRAIAKKNGEQP
jgi:hypothetical protein